MSNNYQIIGYNLRRIRKSNGLSQDDLAAKCKTVDRAKISKIENARVDYMISTLFEICDALNVSVIEMLTKEEE
ncbi:MAG: helix-turn-helix transcriptional regulator [Pedobacter sp.]|uniref:helix-turn-helix domain-containing protein n=1 Tax=Pedobacter sp. TaxID=1411316 RepID=UPI0035641EAE